MSDVRGRIVVGVDGSDPSIDAVRWALGQATLTSSELEVLTSWSVPNQFAELVADEIDWDARARALLEDTLPLSTSRRTCTSPAPPDRAIPLESSQTPRRPPTSSWSGRGGTTGSPACSSARSAPTSLPTHTARSWSSGIAMRESTRLYEPATP